MFKVVPQPKGIAEYLEKDEPLLAYASEGGRIAGRWVGEGSRILGLTGAVKQGQLHFVCRGLSPITGEPFKQLQSGKRKHRSGWSCSVNAPKADSVLEALLPAPQARIVRSAHEAGVAAVIEYLERQVRCRSKGGHIKGSLVACAFPHGTNRNLEPHTHDHLEALNAAPCLDGVVRAIDPRESLYRGQRAATAIYHAARVRALAALGFETEPVNVGSLQTRQIAGLPPVLLNAFSSSRNAIVEHLDSKGLSGGKAAAEASKRTRQAKRHVDATVLRIDWAARAAALGFSPEKALSLFNARVPQQMRLQEQAVDAVERSFQRVVEGATETGSALSKAELVSRTASGYGAMGMDPKVVLERIERATSSGGELKEVTPGRFAPPAIEQLAFQTLTDALEACADGAHTVAAPKGASIAVRQLTARASSLACLEGGPLSSEFSTLKQVAAAHREAPNLYDVIGVAPTKAAAKRFQDAVGVPTDSARATLTRLGLNGGDRAKHVTRQLWRAARKKRAHTLGGLKLTKRSLVLITQAERYYPRRLDELLAAARQAGARVILSGDAFAGRFGDRRTAYDSIVSEVGQVALSSSTEQRPFWRAHADEAFSQGAHTEALSRFIENDCMSLSQSPVAARQAAVSELFSRFDDRPTRDGRAGLLVGLTDEAVEGLNAAAQASARRAGRLGTRFQSVRLSDGTRIHVGERVQVMRGNRAKGVTSGDFGRVLSVKRTATLGAFTRVDVTVRVDGGRRAGWLGVRRKLDVVLRGASELECLRLGYAAHASDVANHIPHTAHVVVNERGVAEASLELARLSKHCTNLRLHVDGAALPEELERFHDQVQREREAQVIDQAAAMEQHRAQQVQQGASAGR